MILLRKTLFLLSVYAYLFFGNIFALKLINETPYELTFKILKDDTTLYSSAKSQETMVISENTTCHVYLNFKNNDDELEFSLPLGDLLVDDKEEVEKIYRIKLLGLSNGSFGYQPGNKPIRRLMLYLENAEKESVLKTKIDISDEVLEIIDRDLEKFYSPEF